ncbi:hypothetical protein BCU91_08505 [Shewanella sp. 10N.286.52.B9]|nr:hypothetical protein BCU91_08505 [Shewanella sp. 10N.286.52.B9]
MVKIKLAQLQGLNKSPLVQSLLCAGGLFYFQLIFFVSFIFLIKVSTFLSIGKEPGGHAPPGIRPEYWP